jgi:hypothetical protein
LGRFCVLCLQADLLDDQPILLQEGHHLTE